MTSESRFANGDSREYWAGAKRGKLVLQRCRACRAWQFPPRHHCAVCWEGEPEWAESSGTGSIESFTVVRRAPLPDFRDKVPYVVAAVLLDEGPRMITNLIGDDALDARIGDRVRVEFQDDGRGETLPQFRRFAQD